MTRANEFVCMAVACALAACRGESVPGEEETRAPAARAATEARAAGTAATHTITLLTGHRVSVSGDRLLSVAAPAPGGSVAVRTHADADHFYVVPVEAGPLLSSGVLDARLFDVRGLIAIGYDDTGRADVPIIVTYQPGSGLASRDAAGSALRAAGAQVVRPLASIGGAAMRWPKRAAAGAWSALTGGQGANRAGPLGAGIARVWLDGVRRPLLDHSAPQIGAPAAWEAGLTGLGVTVAVLDSGIAFEHPDFAGRIAGARSFLDGEPDATDRNGHGTHVASIVAGSGVAGGGYRGVAPEAELLIGKVCDPTGMCPDSGIIAAMEWAAESGATVVNLSLGAPDTPELDPLERAIDELTAEHGTLFVAAGGNSGNCGGPGVASPGSADAALSVGAVDRDDAVAFFSCTGPRVGDGAVKPDLTAPGVDIVAARAAGTPLGDQDPVGDSYARLSGTSMATPHVVGAAAILAQLHPEWRATELKAALIGSAHVLPRQSAFVVGAGRVDVTRAIVTSVLAAPANLNLGTAPPPHDDDEPIVRTVVYQNRDASPVSARLTFDIWNPVGAPAAPGMFTVEPAEVTIPAGGEVQVIVTADTRVPSMDGHYGGVLVATAGDLTVRTPVSLNKQAEMYDLTVDVVDRTGATVEDFVLLLDLDRGFFGLPAGTPTSLPRGRYAVDATIVGLDASGQRHATMLVQPPFELTASRSILMDARLARPVEVTVPAPATARRAGEVVGYTVITGTFTATASLFASDPDGSFDRIYTAQVGAPSPDSDFFASVASHWAEPGPAGGEPFADSPYVYNTAFSVHDGSFPTGLVRPIDAADLAVVEQEFAQSSPVLSGSASDVGRPIDLPFATFGVALSYQLPARRTAYYLAEGVEWHAGFVELLVSDDLRESVSALDIFAPRVLRAGSTVREHWNQAAIGPSLRFPDVFVERRGDQIALQRLPFYSDRANHYGTSSTEIGTVRLFRDGSLVGESESPSDAVFSVPPEAADYRLEVRAIRGGSIIFGSPAELSTRIDLAWTFRSAGDGPSALPVAAVSFTPKLDDRNRAPAGGPFAIPFALSRQTGAPAAPLDHLAVDASYDGGQTWRRAVVVRFGDLGLALVHHPSRAGGTVSLRATAADRDGNTLEQTILDAYHLR
jgi:subtilisin family serine protease